MPVHVVCPCGQACSASDHPVGQRVECPVGGGEVNVVPTAPPPPAEQLIVARHCGRQLPAAQRLWGMQVSCPTWQTVMHLRDPRISVVELQAADPWGDAANSNQGSWHELA